MPLVIEDGSLVAGANSYVTLEEARAFAASRASTLPADDAECEARLIVAMDYLEAQRDRYQGRKVDGSQALQFPRTGVQIDGFDVAPTVIPQTLKDAQCQLAIEQAAGDLMPTGDGREVIRERVEGAVDVQYSPGAGGAPQPIFAKVNALLDPLFKRGGFGLSTRRA